MKIVTDNAMVFLALRCGSTGFLLAVSYGKVYIYML